MKPTQKQLDTFIQKIKALYPTIGTAIGLLIPWSMRSPDWKPPWVKELEPDDYCFTGNGDYWDWLDNPEMQQIFLERVFAVYDVKGYRPEAFHKFHARYQWATQSVDQWPEAALPFFYEWRTLAVWRPNWIEPWTDENEQYFTTLWNHCINKYGKRQLKSQAAPAVSDNQGQPVTQMGR